jgi:hypothetical protein
MAEEKDLWKLSLGDSTVSSGNNSKATHMFSMMDTLVAHRRFNGSEPAPLVIETDNDKVLNKAAEYAAQKGYDLVASTPEQNLQIKAVQDKVVGEEIADGELGPSKQKALDLLAIDKKVLEEFDAAIPYSDDPTMRASERAESAKRHAEIAAREEEYREKGWLPKPAPAVEKDPLSKLEDIARGAAPVEKDDPAADIAKIAEQTKALPDPFPKPAQKEQDGPALAGVQPPRPAPEMSFPEKRPAEVLAHRWTVPTAKDHGNRIVITRMGMLAVTPPQQRERHDLVSAALLKSRERFGEPVRVTGNKAFENAVIKAAIEQGIPLEMGSDRGEKAYALALANEKKRGLEKAMGTLTPSKERGAPERPTATIPPAKAKGQSRELTR